MHFSVMVSVPFCPSSTRVSYRWFPCLVQDFWRNTVWKLDRSSKKTTTPSLSVIPFPLSSLSPRSSSTMSPKPSPFLYSPFPPSLLPFFIPLFLSPQSLSTMSPKPSPSTRFTWPSNSQLSPPPPPHISCLLQGHHYMRLREFITCFTGMISLNGFALCMVQHLCKIKTTISNENRACM